MNDFWRIYGKAVIIAVICLVIAIQPVLAEETDNSVNFSNTTGIDEENYLNFTPKVSNPDTEDQTPAVLLTDTPKQDLSDINPVTNYESQSLKPLERSICQSGGETECTGNSFQKNKNVPDNQVGINVVLPPYFINRTVWYVDASAAESGNGSYTKPFREIQTALDACNASEKNTILINYAGGALYSNFSVEIPDVIIRSESDSESEYATITSSDYTGAVISADNVWLCKLKFNECNKLDSSEDISAGAVFVHDCKDVEIKRCIITECSAVGGGGITFSNADGGIRGTRISDCYAEIGGAITIFNSSARICNSTLYDNFAQLGGGICFFESDSEIHRTEIYDNIGYFGAGFLTLNSETGVYRSNISNNLALLSGGGLSDMSGKTTVHDSKFCNNTALFEGGGIYSRMSETELHSAYITGNTAVQGAGYAGIESTNGIYYSRIAENSANSAPGILISDGNSTVFKSKIYQNILLKSDDKELLAYQQIQDEFKIPDDNFNADSLPAWLPDEYFETENIISGTNELSDTQELNENSEEISVKAGIGISIESSDDVDFRNNLIQDNTYQEDNSSVVFGGGIALMNSSGVISENRIGNNYADLGAGIFCLNSSAEINGNTIKWNNATTGGAGIFLMAGEAEISENTVSYNNILGYGGGILTISGESVISNNNILSNTAGTGGAGICQIGSSSEILENTIESNSAGNESYLITGGGGILITGLNLDSDSADSLDSSETISDLSVISGPDFLATMIAESTARSTASEIYIEEDTLSGDSDSLYDSCLSDEPDSIKSQMFSAGIKAESDGTVLGLEVVIENNTISKNSALTEGGGVKLFASATVLFGNEITDNSAPMGGGSEIESSVVLSILDTVKNNNATIGGGVNVLSSEYIMFDSEITDNEGTAFGGGINTIDGNTILLRTVVSDNKAGTGGGGINSIVSSLAVLGGTITDNSAPGSGNFSGGGGINIIDAGLINQESVSLQSTEIPDISAYLDKKIPGTENENLIHIIPSEDKQDGYESDLLLILDNAVSESLSSVTILNNTASYGGGVNIYGSENAVISGCNISKNRASVSGGGISIISANDSGVVSSIISMNTAPAGDGIYIQDSHDFREFNNLFINDGNILAKATETSPFAWNAWMNLTKENIFTITGSPYSGGSVWAKPDGTGMSQTCTDADLDGICDSCTYTVTDTDGTTVGVDELPLYYNPEYSTLNIKTEPEGAEIEIDGKSYGRKSDAGYYMAPANYSVELTLKDHFDAPLFTTPVKTKEREYIEYSFTDIPEFSSTGSGHAPLNFVADATKTSADLKSWKWHIVSPDGTDNLYDGGSLQTYLNDTGNYTVTLDAEWDSKTTTSVPKIIRVMDAPPETKASEEVSAKINGTSTETLPDGSQVISINTTSAGNVTTTNDGIIVEKPDGTKIKIKTDETPSKSGGSVSGQVKSVTMQQPELNASLGGGLGNASVGVSMTMNEYDEDAGISTEISAGCADDAKNAFSVAVPGLKEVAYTIYFTKSGFDNESAISEAVIDFSVNTSWVNSMGGPQRITIVRWKDDGTSENINPTYLGISGTESLFKVTTDGFSVYGVAGFSVPSSYESSRDDDNSVGITDAENLAAGKTATIKMSSSAFTEISLTPLKEIPDLRITAQVMNYPKSGMETPEGGNASVMEYVKTVLYYTTSASLENVAYTAEIPEKWLEDNNSSFPAVWYYNESTASWNMLEIVNSTEDAGNKIVTVKAEMPGFGWFAVGSVSDEFILGGEDLPLGPGPEITSGIPDETIKPESTKPAEPAETEETERPKPTAAPLPGIVVLTGIFLAAAFILFRREY